MNKFINESKRKFNLDFGLLFFIVSFALLSVVAIYLAEPLLNANESTRLIIQQTVWYIVGFVAIYFILRIGTDRLFSLSYLAYWILMFFLFLLVLARFQIINSRFMPPIKGSHAWFVFPGIGSFQPSEFMKIVLVMISADIIDEHNRQKTDFSFKSDFQLIFKIAKYALPALILNILQPDTGIPIIIIFSLAVIFFLSGVRREWFIIISAAAAFIFFGVVYLYYNNQDLLAKLVGGGHRLERFYGWLDYEKYFNQEGYQLYRSIASYGTAGWLGHPVRTAILHYPEAQTDFIFSVIAQNFGFLGGVVVILLSFGIDIKLVQITLNSHLNKERYMMMGILGMLVFQQFQNMGMIMGILPITGITLPFISYGGSSLLSYMVPMAVAFFMSSENVNEQKH